MVQELYQCDAGDTVVLQEYSSVMQDLKSVLLENSISSGDAAEL